MTQNDDTPTPYRSVTLPTSNLAIVSLIAGIVNWTMVPVIGVFVAVITGYMAKNEIRSSAGRLEGNGLATAGLILGYTNLALTITGICLGIVLPLLGISICGLCSLGSIPIINDLNL
jgi:hypothetical protein